MALVKAVGLNASTSPPLLPEPCSPDMCIKATRFFGFSLLIYQQPAPETYHAFHPCNMRVPVSEDTPWIMTEDEYRHKSEYLLPRFRENTAD